MERITYEHYQMLSETNKLLQVKMPQDTTYFEALFSGTVGWIEVECKWMYCTEGKIEEAA